MRNARSELMRTGPSIGMEEVWFNYILTVETAVAAFIYEVNKKMYYPRLPILRIKAQRH